MPRFDFCQNCGACYEVGTRCQSCKGEGLAALVAFVLICAAVYGIHASGFLTVLVGVLALPLLPLIGLVLFVALVGRN